MDLVNGSKNIIVMMTHVAKNGQCKLKKRCELPLTGKSVVTTIVTNLGIFEPTGETFRIRKLAEGIGISDLMMDADLLASDTSTTP